MRRVRSASRLTLTQPLASFTGIINAALPTLPKCSFPLFRISRVPPRHPFSQAARINRVAPLFRVGDRAPRRGYDEPCRYRTTIIFVRDRRRVGRVARTGLVISVGSRRGPISRKSLMARRIAAIYMLAITHCYVSALKSACNGLLRHSVDNAAWFLHFSTFR